MKFAILAVAATMASFGPATTPAQAQTPPAGKTKQVLIDPTEVILATTVDFGAVLGLDFPSLKGLGARIELARLSGDPVGLASAAHELGIAEKVSGKHAPIKSAELLLESVRMAQLRKQPSELKALALMVDDNPVKEKLKTYLAKAEEEKASRDRGEIKRGIQGSLLIFNNSDRTVAIYINGVFRGNVHGNDEASFPVGDSASDDTEILARSGRFRWGPRIVGDSTTGNYRWTLNPIAQ